MLQAPDPSWVLDLGRRRATLRHAGEPVRTWPIRRIGNLSTARAAEVTATDELLLVEQAAPGAKAVLRDAGISYVTGRGEWHLVDPPNLYVAKPPDRDAAPSASPSRPLGKGAARIARWLLLNPDGESATITDLARSAQVSEATSSRSVRHLADRDLVAVATDERDARRREVTVRDRAAMLDALADEGPWRHARRVVWDAGSRAVGETLSLIENASTRQGSYAVGELAAASLVSRLVEPAMVVLWLPRQDVGRWREALLAEPARPGPGRIAVRVAPDPVVLEWGPVLNGLRLADPVQIYIDCHHAGERAIDVAEEFRHRLVQA